MKNITLGGGDRMVRRIQVSLFIILCCAAQPGWARSFEHSGWTALLQESVLLLDGGRVSQVDYGYLAKEENRARLQVYLRRLAGVSQQNFDGWAREGQLAFLINAYNSWTVELILARYPDLDSIKDLGSFFQSPWKKKFISLFGKTLSLDEIEHGLIRESGRYNEPRIHFAVNCASVGCPALASEAYLGEKLEVQLEGATRLFLSDRNRNRLEGNVLQVSSIFKWYRGDFEQGWRNLTGLQEFLGSYASSLGLSDAQVQSLVTGKMEIKFLLYDWKLNDGVGHK